jgi:hypothetical protein
LAFYTKHLALLLPGQHYSVGKANIILWINNERANEGAAFLHGETGALARSFVYYPQTGEKAMRHTKSGQIALCGILAALSLVILLLGNLFPLATYCAPAMAAVLLLPVVTECGVRYAFLMYLTVALLGMLFLPDRELAFLYAMVLGYYPILKVELDRIRWRILRVAAKLAIFNLSILAAYGLLLSIFSTPELTADFADTGKTFLALLLFVGNVTFLVFDLALSGLARVYQIRLHPKIKRMF